jgi:hypothetical protein
MPISLLWSKPALYAYALIALVLAYGAWHHHVYAQGQAATQALWDADVVKKAADAKMLADKQAEATRIKEKFYADTIARLNAVPPVVIHDRVTQYVRGLCDGSRPSAAVMPLGPAGIAVPAGRDPVLRQPDGTADFERDLAASQRNKAKLNLCLGFIQANGGAKP